ncbi:hypothetical protein [Geomicrobium sp. JCM 19055]|uniref:hypothetical protein n=1 Tax=Geomicrobium sp. JCM 19055 TaxID=1460649 RepID=UPI00045ED598|nr:hypothetical protein [Geomicrobium sp. JCM 19055]GAK01787.1 hypothetical protein JCM19055_4994 [Geomicrobium sp. JCM 19055]
MTPHTLRGLASGLFVAAVVVISFQYFFQDDNESDANAETVRSAAPTSSIDDYTDETLYNALLERDYDFPVSETERIVDEQNEETVLYVVIHEGMTSDDVAQVLVDSGFIATTNEFIEPLYERERQTQIQTGLHNVTNEYSIDEIIETFTTP